MIEPSKLHTTPRHSSDASTMRSKTQNLVITGMFTALLCVLAQITIPMVPIPLTLSVYAIFLIGTLLPPKSALMSVLAYILLGAFGLPVFAGFKGGFHILTGVTGGFIMAYPIMALITAFSWRIARKAKPVALTLGMLISLLICYFIGSLWFSYSTDSSLYYAFTVCVFPFILTDLMKIGLAVGSGLMIRKTLLKNQFI